MKLSPAISKHNYYAFLWHASFLSLARNFMDVDTVIPAMLVEAGGSGIHIGVMTAIMLGGSSFTQLIFAPFISNHPYKKKFLLLGINARIASLLFMGIMLNFLLPGKTMVWLIFMIISIFSLGGAFANVCYTDLLGKSVDQSTRKSFFSIRQVLGGIVLFISAWLAKEVLTLERFPLNYAYMFSIGFLALLLASIGFWRLKETLPSGMAVRSPGHFLQLVRNEAARNNRLLYFLGFINTMGISIALLPFVILYAKQEFHTGSQDTGLFLLYKVIGSVAIGLILFLLNKKFKYRLLLYGNTLLVLVILALLLLPEGMPPLMLIFLLGGIVISVYAISMNGVLLEISNTENRILYTGIAGAGNIVPALFPILGGWIIERAGYPTFFVLYMCIVLFSLFFIYKLNCRK